jgi:CheY-like chemotaxis protein
MKAKEYIIMVDDDADDRFLVQAAFEDNKLSPHLQFFEDGDSLINFLDKNEHQLPQLILLDLNMPGKDGKDVIRYLKNKDSLRLIPIIVFSTSKAPCDINQAYAYGANSYIVKPSGYEQLKAVINNIQNYWINTTCLPEQSFRLI